MDFDLIPAEVRVPGQYVEFDPTRAAQGIERKPYKVLIVGQRTAAGVAAAATPFRIVTAEEGVAGFGAGSVGANMVSAYKAVDGYTETWGLALSDLGGGAAATGVVTITGPSTAAGTLHFFAGGRYIPVMVASGQTATQIATAAVIAINAAAVTDAQVTATNAAGVITLLARHACVLGNEIDLRFNHQLDQVFPAGVGAVVTTPMTGGASVPDVNAVFAAIGDDQYDVIVWPYTDTTSMGVLDAALAERWGPMRPTDGVAICALRGTVGTLATFGAPRNSPNVSIMGYKAGPMTPWEWAAQVAASVAFYGALDQGRPFQTLPLPRILAPSIGDRFSRLERETLLRDGISTYKVDGAGVVRIDRMITTYQKNAAGSESTAYLDLNTTLLLSFLRWSWRNRIETKYPREKLGNDDAAYGADQRVMTPGTMRSEAIAWFGEMLRAGLVENLAGFKSALMAQRDASDPNRLNTLLAPDLINQFLVGATKIQFRR